MHSVVMNERKDTGLSMYMTDWLADGSKTHRISSINLPSHMNKPNTPEANSSAEKEAWLYTEGFG